MENLFIFQNNDEIERLSVQNKLLFPYEKKVMDKLFLGRSNLSVLDIGANDGSKTSSLFSDSRVGRVIALEYNALLVEKAERQKKDDRFSFYTVDVEKADYKSLLKRVMKESSLKGFDIIYISFVLMHLKESEALLISLKEFLNCGGTIVITEADDLSSHLTPDENGLLETFLSILDKDKYSGNRRLGHDIENIVKSAGYGDITIHCDGVSAFPGEEEKKKDIYKTFFSYLPEDVDILLSEDEKNSEYREWKKWIDSNYLSLKELIESPSSSISMGMKILTCRKTIFHSVPLEESEINSTLLLMDECVGKNLYNKDDLSKAIKSCDEFFMLYKTEEGVIGGYIYYFLTDKEMLSSSGKIPRKQLDSVYKGNKCARIQSVGVRKEYSGFGLGTRMIKEALLDNKMRGVEAVYCVCWAPNGEVPLAFPLYQSGFSHLMKIRDYWAEEESLVCPYCSGRCHCNAEVYYKILKEECR